MTTVRNRLWMSYDDIISDVSERLRDVTAHNINRGTLRVWASQGCREFAKRTEILKGVHHAPLVLNQQEYRLPADCIRVAQVIVTRDTASGEQILPYMRESDFLDGLVDITGRPWEWYLKPDRQSIGLSQTPSIGGFDGYTSSAGNAGGTTVVGPSTLSSTDDTYVGMELRIMDGNNQGEEQTISSYDGTTNTFTVDSAFSNQVASGVRFQVFPDTLRIEYIRGGNAYDVLPTTGSLQSNMTRYDTAVTNLPSRLDDFWEGAEIRMTSGGLDGERAQILTSSYDGTNTTVTVFPEFRAKGSSADTFTVTDVPNIPAAYHDAIVEYVVYKAKQREKAPDATMHIQAFLEMVADARAKDEPAQKQEFEQIREYGRGEEQFGYD